MSVISDQSLKLFLVARTFACKSHGEAVREGDALHVGCDLEGAANLKKGTRVLQCWRVRPRGYVLAIDEDGDNDDGDDHDLW